MLLLYAGLCPLIASPMRFQDYPYSTPSQNSPAPLEAVKPGDSWCLFGDTWVTVLQVEGDNCTLMWVQLSHEPAYETLLVERWRGLVNGTFKKYAIYIPPLDSY